MSRLQILFLTATLCGCATVRTYSDPVGDLREYSKIVLSNWASLPLDARTYDDAMSCSYVVNLPGKRIVAAGEKRTIYVKRGQPTSIGAWYMVGSIGVGAYTKCDLNTTFVPTADVYELVFDSAPGAKSCSVRASETSGGETRRLPGERIAVRKFNQAFGPNGPWCKDLTDAQMAALGIRPPVAGASAPGSAAAAAPGAAPAPEPYRPPGT